MLGSRQLYAEVLAADIVYPTRFLALRYWHLHLGLDITAQMALFIAPLATLMAHVFCFADT